MPEPIAEAIEIIDGALELLANKDAWNKGFQAKNDPLSRLRFSHLPADPVWLRTRRERR